MPRLMAMPAPRRHLCPPRDGRRCSEHVWPARAGLLVLLLCRQQPTVSGQTTPADSRPLASVQEKHIILLGVHVSSAYPMCVSVITVVLWRPRPPTSVTVRRAMCPGQLRAQSLHKANTSRPRNEQKLTNRRTVTRRYQPASAELLTVRNSSSFYK